MTTMLSGEKMTKEMKSFMELENFVPKKYHAFMQRHAWIESLNSIRKTLINTGKYEIIEIIPLCVEEFVTMTARDLLVSNLSYSHNDMSTIQTINEVYHLTRKDNGYSAISLETAYVGGTTNCFYDGRSSFIPSLKEFIGFSTIEGQNDYNPMIKTFQEINFGAFSNASYHEEFIFRVKSKDNKKIRIDNPSRSYFEKRMSRLDYIRFEKNFKRYNSGGRIIGE